MIAAWMLYCIAIVLAFVIVGHALERALHLAGRPTRWAWALALAGAVSLAAAAWFRPQAFTTVALPAAERAISAAPAPETSERPFAWSDLDRPLRWAWGVSSTAVILALATAALRLSALRRRWRAGAVDGRAVLVSENVGPAVVGLWLPRVVFPAWALTLAEGERRLMVAHEEEHIRARDPWLLAAGMASLALAPWNVALWWLVRRLRLAVEIDCDARVLRRGHAAPEYGALLLDVGHRLTQLPLGAAALGEPRSFLEHRIRRMAERLPRRRWLGAAAAVVVGAGAAIAACETPRPVAPQPVALLDSARAVALARQNLCGEPSVVRDTTCLVRSYLHTDIHDIVVLDRRPPAGNDVVAVKLSGRDGNLDLEATQVAPTVAGTAGSHRDAVPTRVSVVDERPELLSGPLLQYPDLLRHAGIQGRVIVQAIIDTTGRAEPASVKVIESPNPGFNQSATNWVLRALFRPARANGRAVRALMKMPIEFKTAP
jgi:TonB family protein